MRNDLRDDQATTPAADRQGVADRAAPAAARRGPACLHRLFEARAAADPAAAALTDGDRELSYGELNARSNRLARRLRSLGVGREVLVGIYADRSAEMVVGLLAVLKAGGAYVPLDTAYPADRLGFLLADSGVRVLLTRPHLTDDLPAHAAAVVDLDDPCWGEADDDLDGGAAPAGAAYVIYTSGSTGRPKGVVVTHANVARLLASNRRAFRFGPADVWTLFHSFAFDFSVWEVWGALAFGGRLVVVPYWVSRSPEAFLTLLRDEQVTVLNQTPSAFRQLARADEAAGTPADLALRLVVFGGEALEVETLRRWFDRRGDRTPQLVNMYGITETTVHVTYRPVGSDDLDAPAGSSPIGVGLPGWRVLLLDGQMRPVPVGVVGEVYVGGAGVARGYLDRPGLTAERFLPDPFAAPPGGRLYRSGDLARRRPDGALDYAGRADHQVKVRGFRIELGEIEAALVRHPAVREAVVLPRDLGDDDRRLVAYVAGVEGDRPGPAALRAWLKPRLPQYMIPSAFVGLDALPLTAHGKVDREALPAPEPEAGAARAGGFEPPVTPVELAVAAAWSEVLGLERVGLRDDFFDLGGHSLLATQVVSRVRDALDVAVPLRLLFEAPTVGGLAERVEELRATSAGRGSSSTAVTPVRRDGPAPLSFAQEALWFLEQLAPGRATFNVSAAVRVVGPLDLAALRRAFAAILARHEALRTRFVVVDGAPAQVVVDPGASALEVVDLGGLPESERPAEASRRAVAEGRVPFDLAVGPLARGLVLRLNERDHAVVLTMHHVVTDGWSFGVAARELALFYEAERVNRPSATVLPPLPVQYADYAAWQRLRLRGELLDGLLDDWTGRLRGVPVLELPTDRPRPAVRGSRGGVHHFRVSEGLAAAVRKLGRREGTTPFMTLLAAFQATLCRYSGQVDFAVGSPVANRGRSEVEGLIGYFINMLAIRADVAGDPTFRELLGRVRAAALGAFEHQELPFERVVEALRPGRDLSRTPVFQVMFVFQNNEMPDAARSDLTVRPLDLGDGGGGTGTAKFDLTLALADDGPGMVGSWEFDADLFDPATVERLAGHYLNLLAGATAAPDLNVSDLPLAGAAERRQVIDDWNQTSAPVPPATTVQGLFEAQADRTPGATAWEWAGGRFTYGELDAQANRLAHGLRALGVGPDVRVGIAADRSAALGVALLGVLKAGGAYVPLDPAYPRDRLAAMRDDAGLTVILTQQHLMAQFAAPGVTLVDLDADPYAGHGEGRPGVAVGPENAAYVIYTSGSTGRPRGVVATHGGLANHALAAADLFGLAAGDRVLQFASLSFDIAVEEVFPAWSRGAAVVLRGGDETLEPARFHAEVESKGVTVLDLPTAYWHAWVNDLAARGGSLPGSLRLVVVGGEKASASALGRWRSVGGDRVRWLNTYGPTEATVIATAYEPAGADDSGGEVPIGRPIRNARVYVLDDRRRPAPLGVPGELFLGGRGVARGYLGRPGATAERFLPDPFDPVAGSRMFRTGDRVRWRADGELEFLGRTDDQVKVRGYRVEPGEVEAAILAHPGVRSAAVVAAPDASGALALIAYAVAEPGAAVTPEALARSLRAILPGPMAPSRIALLNALPMTPSGKVDRRSLLDLTGPDSGLVSTTLAPRDDLEASLAAVWEDVLGVRPVGVTDDFFELGGHSLLAIRLLARVEEVFGRRLALAALFLGPTVADQANLLRVEAPTAGEWSPLVPIRAAGAGRPFFCVHPAGGVVYCYGELAQALGDDRPFLALQAAGLDGDRAPLVTVGEMAAGYLAAVRRAQPEGPYHLGGWSLGGVLAFEMARQLVSAGEVVATLAVLDATAPTGRPPALPRRLRRLAAEVGDLDLLGPRPPGANPADDALVIAEFAGDLARGFGGQVPRLLAHLRALDADARRLYLLSAFKLDQVYHLETGPERVARLLAVLRANLLAVARYEPGVYPGRVSLFVARDRQGSGAGAEDLGWGRIAAGGVTTRAVAGDHAGMLRTPNVATLAGWLRDEFARHEGLTS